MQIEADDAILASGNSGETLSHSVPCSCPYANGTWLWLIASSSRSARRHVVPVRPAPRPPASAKANKPQPVRPEVATACSRAPLVLTTWPLQQASTVTTANSFGASPGRRTVDFSDVAKYQILEIAGALAACLQALQWGTCLLSPTLMAARHGQAGTAGLCVLRCADASSGGARSRRLAPVRVTRGGDWGNDLIGCDHESYPALSSLSPLS